MSNEMVERVARALCRKRANQPAGWMDRYVDDNWQSCADDARAAIEAMRVPTDRMCNRGAAKWDDDWCTETNALNMWQGMIDTALGE